MAVDLEPPYEDEALYSVVARYFRATRVGNYFGALTSIFGSGRHLSPGRLHSLNYVADQCRSVWPWSAVEIAELLTVYPYFAAVLAKENAQHLLKQMCEDTGYSGVQQRLLVGVRLRYCPACLAEDRLADLPAYWRRQHLLPGVVVCSKHGEWLQEISPGRSRQHGLLLPNSVENLAHGIELELTSAQADACVRVSQISKYLLHHRVSVLPGLTGYLQESARAAGFSFGPARIRTADLSHALVEHFGEAFLRYVDAHPECAVNWVALALRGTLPAAAAHKVVLLAEFLSSLQTSHCDEAWPVCPHAQAGPGHAINLRVRHGERYIAKCSCGLSFVYSGVIDGIPQNVKPTRYGFLADDVSRLRREGWSKKSIALRFGIAQGTVRKVCRPSAHYRKPLSPEARAKRIAEWRLALREFGTAKAAGRSRPGLYLWIRRYAREALTGG